MMEDTFEILDKLLSKASVDNIDEIHLFKNNTDSIIDYWVSYNTSLNNLFVESNQVLLDKYQNVLAQIDELNRSKSVLFNPLSFFGIGETMHSFLLAKLLSPYAEHGQKDIFLKCFLEMLGIEFNEKDHWVVTAEKGRIDILLKRKHPHAVVIIENKSNNAVDQENQIYRYWYQEIYLPNKHHANPLKHMNGNSNYQIVYLTPSDWKKPAENSLLKPSWYDSDLPERVPIEPKIWLFNKQVVTWLERCLDVLPEDNHRIREYVKQYKELWQ